MKTSKFSIWWALLVAAIAITLLFLFNIKSYSQESLLRILGQSTQIAQPPCDTNMIVLMECPPKIKAKPRNVPISVPKSIIKKDTSGIYITLENNITIGKDEKSVVEKDPYVNYDMIQDVNKHNLFLSQGDALFWGGLGLQVSGVIVGVIGASRSYDFNILENNNVLTHDGSTIESHTALSNMNSEILRQEKVKRSYFIIGGSLFVIGTGLEIWGICKHSKMKLIITPDGGGFQFNF